VRLCRWEGEGAWVGEAKGAAEAEGKFKAKFGQPTEVILGCKQRPFQDSSKQRQVGQVQDEFFSAKRVVCRL
jgi:hypothetical protein